MHEYKKWVEEINLADAASAGSFLDGCKVGVYFYCSFNFVIALEYFITKYFWIAIQVFLSGFSNQELDKMKKLINRSGATQFPEISDRLSHVIMGEFLPDHVKEIEKLSEK